MNMKMFILKKSRINYLATILIGLSLAGCNGNSSSSSSANGWQQVGATLPYSNVVLNSIAISNAGNLYVGGSADVNNGLVSEYQLSSGAWLLTGLGYIPNPNSYIAQVSSVAVSANNVVYAAANANHNLGFVFNTSGTGGAWQLIGENNVPDRGIINAIAVSSNGNVYAATSGYNISNNVNYGNVYTSSGISSSWQKVGGESAPNGGGFNAIALTPGGNVIAASGGYNLVTNSYFGNVYINNGTGGAWQEVGGGALPDGGVANSLVLLSLHDEFVEGLKFRLEAA